MKKKMHSRIPGMREVNFGGRIGSLMQLEYWKKLKKKYGRKGKT
jgi:hypothetical protein